MPYALLARLLRAILQRYSPRLEEWISAELARLLPELGAAPASKLQPLRLQHAVAQTLLAARDGGLSGCVLMICSSLTRRASNRCSHWLLPMTHASCIGWQARARAEMPSALTDWMARGDTTDIVAYRSRSAGCRFD